MEDDDDDIGENNKRNPRKGGNVADSGGNPAGDGIAMGPIYVFWENSLEKLKILGYEATFCLQSSRKPFSRIHFVFPAQNTGHQFEDFIKICSWLFTQITNDPKTFQRDEYDDPNTVVNKLMLALRQIECKLSFPVQKLKIPHGEAVCQVLDFLTEKALEAKSHQWKRPEYPDKNEKVDFGGEDEERDDEDDIQEDDDVGIEEDIIVRDALRDSHDEVDLDIDARQIVHAQVDPVAWKTELERVGPKLRTQQNLATNEWRSHVDQTVTNKSQIEKILGETDNDLKSMEKDVSEELSRMKTKEGYINKQFALLCGEFKEIKQGLEEVEAKSSKTTDRVMKLTNELNEHSERLEELKESFDSRDSGMQDTSPLVRIKAALQQIKQESQAFDLRIGVVSHALLTEKLNSLSIRRSGAEKKNNRRKYKNGRNGPQNDYDSDNDDLYNDS